MFCKFAASVNATLCRDLCASGEFFDVPAAKLSTQLMDFANGVWPSSPTGLELVFGFARCNISHQELRVQCLYII